MSCFQKHMFSKQFLSLIFKTNLFIFHISKKTFFLFLIFCRSMLRSNVASNAEVQDVRSVNCPTQISCDDAKYSPYRSINGSCNNLNHPNWGTIFSPQPRYQPAQYDDGITCFFYFILQATHSVVLFLILIFITP